MHKIKITPPFITLDALLKFAGIAETGGEAKLIISEGYVLLNGQVCTRRKKKIYENDEIETDGEKYKVVL